MADRSLTLFVFVIALIWATEGVGQAKRSEASSGQSRNHRRTIPGGVRSMKGCVVKDSEGEYSLASQRGRKIKLTSIEDLAGLVGKQVKASGSFVEPEPPSGADSAATATAKKLHRDYEFRVLKIDVLAQSCASPSKKR